MSIPPSILVVLLVPGVFTGFVGAVFPRDSEFDRFEKWSPTNGQPITGTDSSGHPSTQSIESSDWPIQAQLLPPLAACMSDGAETSTKKYPAASKHSINRICHICNRVFKNKQGVLIHAGKVHRDLQTAVLPSPEDVRGPLTSSTKQPTSLTSETSTSTTAIPTTTGHANT